MQSIMPKQFQTTPVVSFCIPTFNRVDKTYALVSEVLSYPNDDIEVIVLDNCSTDNTKKTLSTIKDNRFYLYENEINIGGKDNCIKALTLGIGKYACICLDKDFINHIYIKNIISFLKHNPDIAMGYCALNIEKSNTPITYEIGLNSIYNMAYLSLHPSGIFYRNDLLHKLDIYVKKDFYNSDSGFFLDFINAEMCMLGKTAKLNFPLISTESKKNASENVSHSYSGNDLFFLPEKQYELFNLYKNHLSTLNISKKDKSHLTNRLFLSKLISSTLGFNSICKDKLICLHYGFKPNKTGFFSILTNDLLFCKKFILTCNYRTMPLRLGISLKANLYFLFKIIISKLKKVLI